MTKTFGREVSTTYYIIRHQFLEDDGVEPGVDVTAKHSCRDVEAAPNFALRQAMHILRQIVSKPSTLAIILRKVGGRYN